MKNNVLIVLLSIILVILIVGGFYILHEYKEFKSDYELYLSSLYKINEFYVEKNDYVLAVQEYEKVKLIETKYQKRMFRKAFRNVQTENKYIIEEIENKRREQMRSLDAEKSCEQEHNEFEMEEMKRKEQERVQQQKQKRLEQERMEKEYAELQRIERERIEKENHERARSEELRLKKMIEEERLKKEEEVKRAQLEKERIERELLEQELKEAAASGKINGYYYVDLGLSVCWATCNVGASLPEESGNYYAWGEISDKTSYTIQNCITEGKIIDDISGNPEYDVARYIRNNSWRIPTKSELHELKSKCKWRWIQLKDVNGYMITGPNGNSIFLPAAGYKSNTSLKRYAKEGNYWSSSTDNSHGYGSYHLRFTDNYIYEGWISRSNGLLIRPVLE